MKIRRRRFMQLAAGAVALPAFSSAARAQAYPTRPITMIVPFNAGGPSDLVARVVGEHMSRTLGQQIIVENVVGAGGTMGSARAMRASPDGYTIALGQIGTHAVAVALYPNLPYKPDVDFAPIGLVVDQAVVIVARKDFPPADLKEFAAYLKANGDKLNMAHSGIGSISHFSGLLLNSVLGAKPTLVPFSGGAPAVNALIGGQVDYMCEPISEIARQAQAGTIKIYAIGMPDRNAALPAVPTTKEAGLPEFQTSAWYALFAPKGTQAVVLDALSDALDKALDDDKVRKRLSDLGCDIPAKSRRGQKELAALVKSEIARWSPIIRAASSKG
jgi:tripartite-type tricarboxylate transporter receptor subunit TctC